MLNIKLRNRTTLTNDERQYLEKRFSKIEKLLPENSFIEVEFIDQYGERGGVDKKVEVDITIPGEKNPLHLENSAINWMTSIDILKDRLEENLLTRKDKIMESHRQPREDKQA